MNWDDLRYILAVADQGSVSGAARQLGVTHATVLRRVSAFEAEQGGAVFDKHATGYRVRQDRQRVIEAAREVAAAVGTVDRLMHGVRAPVGGVVRISSTDTFCRYILPGLVETVRRTAPELQLELLSSNEHLDLGQMQADISVRPTMSLPDDMTGDIVANLTFGAFDTPDTGDIWLGLTGRLAYSQPAKWMERAVPKAQISASSDSFLALAELARLGLGIALLPTFLGNATPGLRKRADLTPEMSVPVWTATHVDLAESPRIRLARQHVAAHLDSMGQVIAGV
ncbi:MAG: LysR family transcriptional regulator [Paracoccaceae bacterium]